MARWLMLACGLALAAAGCGEEETAAPAAPPTELTVRVDRDGRGGAAARELRVRCHAGHGSPACAAAAALQHEDFEPTPPTTACTEIFGGPETARVRGTLDGEPVAAEFSRVNGCEINRWDAVAPLLRLAR